MGLLDDNNSVLRFVLQVSDGTAAQADKRSVFWLLHLLNATEWRGKEAESCCVVEIKQITNADKHTPATFIITVGYRPDGWITGAKDDGSQRLNGWMFEVREGRDDEYQSIYINGLAEFNDYEFGEFLGERINPKIDQ